MDLQLLFNQAAQKAESGEYREAAKSYETFLQELQRASSAVPVAQRSQLVRSAAFNLAQVLNKLGDFQAALRSVELGLAQSPTALGQAIALAAKGEALCGLGRSAEGKAAFAEAVRAHPVVGRLNAADSMTRLAETEFWQRAEEWVQTVLTSSSHLLDAPRRAEADTILGKIAVRRGHHDQARRQFEKALAEYPQHEDAKLQLRLLAQPPLRGGPSAPRWFARLFGRK